MKLRTFLLIWGASVIFAGVSVWALLYWMADPLNLRAPSDQDLSQIFYNHRSDLEKLRLMGTQDSLLYITDSSLSSTNISKSRQKEYRKLLDRVYPGLIEYAGNTEAVKFRFAGGGIISIGPEWSKGIEYLAPNYKRYETILPSLDKARLAPEGTYLRPLDSNWFLVYQQD